MTASDSIRSWIPAKISRLLDLRHAQTRREFIEDLHADRLARQGLITCGTHLFFIAGLPKSGTTWLEQLLKCTPGMVQLNRSLVRNYPAKCQLNHPHDLTAEMLTCAPAGKLSFLKLHLNPSPGNIEILHRLDIKTIVLIRDLRDMLISRYHHVLSQPSHWDYERLLELPEELRLLESMRGLSPGNSEIVIDYYRSWVEGWLRQAENSPDRLVVIRYEDLRDSTISTLQAIYRFYDYQISTGGIEKIVMTQKKQYDFDKSQNLSANLNQTGRLKSTFRKGKTGEWKKVFDQQTRDFIKEHAGTALIMSGYEPNCDW